MKYLLQLIPAIHHLQDDPSFQQLMRQNQYGKEFITNIFRDILTEIRTEIISGNWDDTIASREEMCTLIFKRGKHELEKKKKYYLSKTINATGTVLHTNLGRARLSDEAIRHIVDISKGYSNLEYDISQGTRGSRHSIVETLLIQLTGAESAMVVNNNAAAVYLVLRALAKDQDVIVSRGQLVEIGGSFRISAIMEESGARLIEVGTTNKTHLKDYEDALTDHTSMVLKVHTSNFKTIGFTKTVEVSELVALRAKKDKLVIYEDLGSGVLFDFAQYGIGDEPVIKDIIAQGVDLVSFSGDKLLGGPQAGIIVGKNEWIEKLKKHQLARVLRVDKMSYAALEATLLAYLQEKYMDIPTIRDITASKEEIKQRCQLFSNRLLEVTNDFKLVIREDCSPIGGGTMPGVEVPTYVVCIQHPSRSAEEISQILREYPTPIISRIKNEAVVLDFRTIMMDEIGDIVKAFLSIR